MKVMKKMMVVLEKRGIRMKGEMRDNERIVE